MHDVLSNIKLIESHSALSRTAAAYNGTSIDMSLYGSASVFIDAGNVNTTGTLDGKLQMSDDNSSWTDEDGATGNGTSHAQVTAAGTTRLNVPRPQKRYYRYVGTTATAAVVFSAVWVANNAVNMPV